MDTDRHKSFSVFEPHIKSIRNKFGFCYFGSFFDDTNEWNQRFLNRTRAINFIFLKVQSLYFY